MTALTVADFDVANVIISLGVAGGVLLSVQLVTFAWRRVLGFFR